MTRKELHEVLDEAVGPTPRIDLAEAAWAQGVGMRRRRRAALAGGGTLVAAAAVVGAMLLSGTLPVGEDVAPAVPTQTPGPTQVEPGPVGLEQARTFLLTRTGTEPGPEAIAGVADLASLDDVGVPELDDLVGTSWDLYTAMRVDDIAGEPEPTDTGLRFGDERTTGIDVATELTVGEDRHVSLSMDQCGDASFSDMQLAGDGRFTGLLSSTDEGCDWDAEIAENFWMSALVNGGWLHQPDADILLLSVMVPVNAEPEPAPTQDAPTDLANARTMAFVRPGSDPAFDPKAVPRLTDQPVPAVEDLAGTAWDLVPFEEQWSAGGDDADGSVTMLEAEELQSQVPTQLQFLDHASGDLLSVAIADCGGGTYLDSLKLDAEGRFAGQEPFNSEVGCAPQVQAAEDFWLELLPQGGWLHQPTEDILLLSVVVPEGSVPDPAPTDGGAPLSGDPATWRLLDPGAVTVESETIRVGVTRSGCSGGVTGEVLEPVVTYESDRILIRTDVAPLPDGAYACPGNDEVEVELSLGEAIGPRHLVDETCQAADQVYGVCGGMFRWTYPLPEEPETIMTDPYFIASTPQDLVDWGSQVVYVEVVAEREIEPRFPLSLSQDGTARAVDLRVWEVVWSHPDAVTHISAGDVVSLEISPGWIDDRPAVLDGDTRLEVGHAYTLALVDDFFEEEQVVGRLLGSITEVPTIVELAEVVAEVEVLTADPARGPRPGESWDERFIRGGGQG